MMTFEKSYANMIATNSLKPVIITKAYSGGFMLHTPEGGLLDNFKTRGPFVDFEAAKRNAEMNVGMKMNWSDF
jgi:hypothetical protein